MKKKSETQIINPYSWRSLIFSILSAGYFLSIDPMIEKMSLDKFTGERTYFPVFGIMILVFSILEIFVFPRKIKLVKKILRETGDSSVSLAIIFWVPHIWISYGALTIALSSFGFNFSNSQPDNPFWYSLLLIAVFFKELYLIAYIVINQDISKAKFERLKKNELFYDIILLLYSWIAFTVIWTGISNKSRINLHEDNIFLLIFNYFSMSVLFLIMYLPVRMPLIMDEYGRIRNDKDFISFVFSILLVLVAVLSRM